MASKKWELIIWTSERDSRIVLSDDKPTAMEYAHSDNTKDAVAIELYGPDGEYDSIQL